jgi:replication factor C small subunit
MWISKYRPMDFDTIVISKETRNILTKWKNDGEFPNLLLCSRPGMGKTSLAHIIAKEFECDKMYINASDEGNVDTIRNKVKDFAMTASFNGKMKIVILDEADGFSNIQSQKILRALMEEVADTCRFIITANYRHKIIEPIISRCVELDMTPPKKDIIMRCLAILKSEGVAAPKDQLHKLRELVEAFYPDVRSVIKTLQNCVTENNVLSIGEFKAKDIFVSNLIDYIMNNNAVSTRKFIIENENEFNGDYNILLMSLYRFMINSEEIDYSLRAEWTIIIAEYLYRMTSAIDAEICMAACIAEMIKKIAK